MRVLVTGGAGFIGSHIADKLIEAGCETAVLDNLSTGKRANIHPDARFYEIDIRDRDSLRTALREFSPDAVSHQAAQASVSFSMRHPGEDAQANILGTLNLLEAVRDFEVKRFVFASTGGAIYGEVPEGTRAQVDWTPRPISPYACSKLAGETYLEMFRAQWGLPYNTLRYANVYGPRQDPQGEAGVVAIFSRRLLAGDPLQVNARLRQGDDGCVRDYVDVGDVADVNLQALRGNVEATILNVCTGLGLDTYTLAQELGTALKRDLQIKRAARRAGDVERSVLDPGPLDSVLGRPPQGIRQGLERTARWFRESEQVEAR